MRENLTYGLMRRGWESSLLLYIYFHYKFFSGLSSVTLLTLCFILSIKESEAKKAKYFQHIIFRYYISVR